MCQDLGLESTEVYLGIALTSLCSGLLQIIIRCPLNWWFYIMYTLGTLAGAAGWYAETSTTDEVRAKLLKGVAVASATTCVFLSWSLSVLNDFRKYHAGDHGLNNDQYDHMSHHASFGLGKDSGVSMPEIIACMAFTVWTLIVHAISVAYSFALSRSEGAYEGIPFAPPKKHHAPNEALEVSLRGYSA